MKEKWVPVGDIAANVSAPTALKPKAVILLGNILKESKDEEMLDVGIPKGDEFTYPGQIALTLIVRVKIVESKLSRYIQSWASDVRDMSRS